jgi:hypothetical protein
MTMRGTNVVQIILVTGVKVQKSYKIKCDFKIWGCSIAHPGINMAPPLNKMNKVVQEAKAGMLHDAIFEPS